MKYGAVLGFTVSAIGVSVGREVAENPLGKVIDLLGKLSADVTKDGEAADKAYRELFEWCDEASRNSEFAIKTSSGQKAKLEARIAKLTADIESASSKIDSLAGKVAKGEKEFKEEQALREQEHADFVASEKELMEVVDAVGRALGVLEKEMAKNPSLAQVDPSNMGSTIQALNVVLDAASITSADQNRLTSLLQAAESSQDDAGAPAAAVYKSKSGNIVEVLEDMKDKAETQLATMRKEELNNKHNHEMLQQSTKDQINQDKKDMESEKDARSEASKNKASSESDLGMTAKLLTESQAKLAKTRENCIQSAADHETTVAARKEELGVIAQAVKALKETSSGAVSQTYSLLQLGVKTVGKSRSAEMIRQLAVKYHSQALTQLTSRITSEFRMGATLGEDPFQKIRGMIGDMISKLKQEMNEEASEKAYCDEQMSKTEEKKADLESEVGKISSKMDQSAARSAELKEQVSELQSQLSAISKEQAEMDKIRQESNADYKTAKADLELGLSGVRKALTVLRDYYGSDKTSLVQENMAALMQQPQGPESHSASTGAGGSIIGILEVVESDFAKNLAKEETEESNAEEEYEKNTQENKIARTEKEQGVKYKTKESVELDKSISELSGDRDTSNSEMTAVLEYYAKIKERCIAKPESYEDRKARRDAEIAGLKEALQVLEEESAGAFVQKRHSRTHHVRGSAMTRD